jgi:HEPN domain-containing protein
MTPKLEEWVEKAEGDFHTAKRERAVTEYPNYDAVCFHSQQCVEKYLKSALVYNDIPIKKSHNLVILLGMVVPIHPLWEAWRKSLRLLNSYAVEFRYPGDTAIKEEAEESLK